MLLDHCLDDFDNFTVLRTDIASKVMCPGRRFGAMFLVGGVGVDLVEVGEVWDALGAGKRHQDQGKLRELMEAMVKVLWEMSKCDDEARRSSRLRVCSMLRTHIDHVHREQRRLCPAAGNMENSPT